MRRFAQHRGGEPRCYGSCQSLGKTLGWSSGRRSGVDAGLSLGALGSALGWLMGWTGWGVPSQLPDSSPDAANPPGQLHPRVANLIPGTPLNFHSENSSPDILYQRVFTSVQKSPAPSPSRIWSQCSQSSSGGTSLGEEVGV